MNFILRWAKKEYPLPLRLSVMALAALIFLGLIPYTLIIQVPKLDGLLHLPAIQYGWISILTGLALILCGMLFALWSIGEQLFKARGTPLPMLPTRELLVSGPFRYCRNPMTFGTICAYGGVGIVIASPSAILCVAAFGASLILYLKRIEERELAIRFGEEYLAYKSETPFMIPHLPGKNRSACR